MTVQHYTVKSGTQVYVITRCQFNITL